MQDKDFDQFIRNAAENFPAPAYNPADWDRLEDQLHNLNAPQAQPSLNPLRKFGFGKAAMVVSAVVVTTVNAVLFVKSDRTETKPQTVTESNQVSEVENTPLPENTIVLNEEAYAVNQENRSNSTKPAQKLNAPVSGETDQPAQAAGVTENAAAEQVALNQVRDKKTGGKNSRATSRRTNKAAGSTSGSHYNAGATGFTSGNGSANGFRTNVTGGSQPNNSSNSVTVGCAGNQLPEIAYAVVNADTVFGTRIALSACRPAIIKLNTTDKDGDPLTVTTNVSETIPGATLIIGKGAQPSLALKLPATLVARQKPYSFTVWLHDNRCPNTAPRPFAFSVSITPAYTIAVNGITQIEKGQWTMLEAVGAPEGSVYKWTSKNLAGSLRTAKISVNPVESAVYAVLVTAPGGCTYTDSVKVTVANEAPDEEAVKVKNIPNIFTPNGDGANDYFEVKLPEAGSFGLVVFDRWSKKVYSSHKYQNNWEAENLPAGTYYYVITTQDKKTYKGWVEVRR